MLSLQITLWTFLVKGELSRSIRSPQMQLLLRISETQADGLNTASVVTREVQTKQATFNAGP
jgi:hypothetical protein